MSHPRSLALISLCMLCAACSSNTVRDTLGLSRAAPDEFRVVSRPPLSVPPQFMLNPPSASSRTHGTESARDQAQSLMTGNNAASSATPSTNTLQPGNAPTAVMPVTVEQSGSPAESQFLQRAGATGADPQVREKMAEERYVAQEKQQDDSWWNIFGTSKKDTVVDAPKESERIKTDADAGKPVTEGDTASIKPKDTGLFGRIFGY